MTKRVFLGILLTYASTGVAMPSFPSLKNLQPSSLIEQVRAGLHSSMPPKSTLDDAWYSTFFMYFETQTGAQAASAFVVHSAWQKDGRRVIDLVTADHVLTKNCDARTCHELQIFSEVKIVRTLGTGVLNFASGSPLVEPNLRILARDGRADLALVRITVDADLDPRPIRLSHDAARVGERVWAIGYPQIFQRTSGHDIDERNVLTRRWSEGEVTGGAVIDASMILRPTVLSDASASVGTTNDSMPGSSGGPVVDDAGELVGVMKVTGAVAENRFEYRAGEKIPSVITPVAAVRGLLDATYARMYAQADRPTL